MYCRSMTLVAAQGAPRAPRRDEGTQHIPEGREAALGVSVTAPARPGSIAPHERLPEILVVPREKTPTAPQLEETPETPPSSLQCSCLENPME